MPPTAVIIGAGPAGLTAAYELLTRTGIHPIVLEQSRAMGGLSQTVEYRGNRMDIGGHRFFSKSDRVMSWWLDQIPLASEPDSPATTLTYHRQSRPLPVARSGGAAAAPALAPAVHMLVRPRQSRIYFLRQFFDYPLKLNTQTLRQLGLTRVAKIGASYAWASVFPPRKVENLEEFFISRFGRELYLTFFKSYTEKVWGVPCRDISAAWGAQRIKGLSIRKALAHMLRRSRPAAAPIAQTVAQKDTETSLIEQFLYPPLGPGQLWEQVAGRVRQMGGEIRTGISVDGIVAEGNRITAVASGQHRITGDYFFSTMAVKDLIAGWQPAPPPPICTLAAGLQYRDFITVGLLLKKLALGNIRDNWIYIQEPDVLAGRLQIFNNWSPGLVRDPATVWIGVEYFCYESDALWRLPHQQMAELAIRELETIGILHAADVLDSTVVHMPKTYPAYFGPAYARFAEMQAFLDGYENLFPVGRNGMHKYNNQDHSMLTAMTAVDNIIAGRKDKSNLWAVNTEDDYHEGKQT